MDSDDFNSEEFQHRVAAAASGDEASLNGVVKAIEPFIWAIVRNGMAPGVTNEDKEDVKQEAALAVASAIKRLGEDIGNLTALKAWIARITRCQIVNFYRRRKGTKPTLSLDPGAMANNPIQVADPYDWLQQVIGEELIKTFLQGRYLTKEEMKLIDMRLQGIEIKEIARILEVSLGTLYRWFEKIRIKFEEFCEQQARRSRLE